MRVIKKKTLIGCLFLITLSGCSLDKASKVSDADSELASNKVSAIMTSTGTTDVIAKQNELKSAQDMASAKDLSLSKDLQSLRDQLQQQQQRLEVMNNEQQVLQEQLKRQSITLQIKPAVNANAGRANQGTASTAYIAFLEEESQFAEVEELASKEISVIPNRASELSLTIPQDAKFIAIKVGLRYTKKRSQLLIPLASINFDEPLAVNIGACDINITAGIQPELTPNFMTKLKYYQQPLVSCS